MTTDIYRLILFFSILILIQGGIDYYLYKSIQRYEKIYGSSITSFLIAYKYLSYLLLVLLVITSIERLILGSNTNSGRIPQILIALWYLPKYPIALFLSIIDLFRFFRVLMRRLPNHKEKYTEYQIDYGKRKTLHSIGLGIASIPFLATAKGVLHTIYDVEIRRIELIIPRLSPVFDGFQITQISDIHTGSLFGTSYIEHIIQTIEQESPDMITITGDYVNFNPTEFEPYVPFFTRLTAKHGVFGSLGNHDHYMNEENHEYLQSLIRKAGIELLINDARTLELHGAYLSIAGTDNTGFNQHYGDLLKACKNIPKGSPTILMAHDPTYWNLEIRDSSLIDLTLSGHTHGGQIGFEYLGSAFSPAQFVYEHWDGLYEGNGNYLYVNRGLGTVGPPIRIGIRPEITCFTLRSPIA